MGSATARIFRLPSSALGCLSSGLGLLAISAMPLHAAEDTTITSGYTGASTVQADNTIATSGTVNVGSSANVTFQAGSKVTLATGFSVTSGGQFRVQIGHVLPYFAGFESGENFTTGSIHTQRGWMVSQGAAAIVTSAYAQGARSLELTSGGTAAVAPQRFLVSGSPNTIFLDLSVLPVAASTAAASSVFQSESVLVGYQISGEQGEVYAFDGVGANVWLPTGIKFALDGSNRATAWIRLTIRADYTNKSWDIFVNGTLADYDLAFLNNSETFFRILALGGVTSASSYVDGIAVQETNPLFTDTDKDGLPDSWEPGGTSATRSGDDDGDGRSNILEYFQGTSPSNADVTPPGAPPGLAITSSTDSAVNLVWSAATDPSSGGGTTGVGGYRLYRNGTLIASPSSATFSYGDTGLTASTAYTYTLKAVDLAGNLSSAATASTTTASGSTSTSFEVLTPIP